MMFITVVKSKPRTGRLYSRGVQFATLRCQPSMQSLYSSYRNTDRSVSQWFNFNCMRRTRRIQVRSKAKKKRTEQLYDP